jgi:hypothetical protein
VTWLLLERVVTGTLFAGAAYILARLLLAGAAR